MKILNFGSVNIDLVYQVKAFVKPGETVDSLGLEKHSGGKGFNQSIALSRAGCRVYHAGHIGEDGVFLKASLEQAGINTKYLETVKTPTGHAIIQVNEQGENCILLYAGANHTINQAFCDKVFAHFEAGDVLVLQNEINELDYIMDQAYKKGMRIAFNPLPMNDNISEEMIRKSTWLLVNEIEARSISGEKERNKQMATLREKFPQTAVVMTLGKEGVWYSDSMYQFKQAAYPVKAVDTTAAGDTFTGFFLAMILEEREVSEALRVASQAAAISVTKPGAADSIPSLLEVEQETIKIRENN